MAKERKPVGKAIPWTDADIDRLSQITPEDITSAKAHAARLMPKRLRPLLNAKKRNGRDAGNPPQ